MAETIILDAAGIAVNRTALDLTPYVLATSTAVDWGDADIQSYTASLTVGEVRLHYRLPNRLIKIPLALRTSGATTFATIRSSLQAKVGLFQREGGWIMRQVGATPFYADIQSATLHLGGSWLQAYRDVDVDAVLALEVLPDWYGDEVTLSDHVETTLPHLIFTEATVNGNYPGRVRLVVDNDQATDQLGLLWGFQAKNYNAGTTAALFYEAEKLQPLNNAAAGALTFASGGSAVTMGTVPANAWVPMLATNMMPGTVALTHQGSYRVWARCFAGTIAMSFRLQWGVGSLSTPRTNDPVQLPGTGAYYLLDLGEARLDAPPVGPNQWVGSIQAFTPVATSTSIDCVYFQPLDEGAGKLTYSNVPPASSLVSTAGPGTAANDAATGTVVWSNTSNALAAADGSFASVTLSAGQTSEYLKLTGYGFALPTGATILGIQAQFYLSTAGGGSWSSGLRLVKAGTVLGATPSSSPVNSSYAYGTLTTYGGPTDLWGTSWAASDINNSGFGAAVSIAESTGTSVLQYVDYVAITVYYVLATGFTVASDAVIYASKTAELRTDGMFRQASGGTIYGPVSSVIGDLPRLPPSGLEARTVRTFIKASRGDFDQLPDAGIDDISAKITYRPSYLITP